MLWKAAPDQRSSQKDRASPLGARDLWRSESHSLGQDRVQEERERSVEGFEERAQDLGRWRDRSCVAWSEQMIHTIGSKQPWQGWRPTI